LNVTILRKRSGSNSANRSFFCLFDFGNLKRSFQIFEAERTPELEGYMSQISAAVSYVNQTFSLFQAAREVRPERLLTPVKR